MLDAACVPLSPKAALIFNKVSIKFNHGLIGDMVESRWLFVECSAIALGLGFLFLFMLCLCAGVIAWLLVFGLFITFLLFGILLLVNLYYTGPLNDSVNALRVKYLSYQMKNEV